jgi:23S rRNA-/tRNA-specific pseudouridylate synthase
VVFGSQYLFLFCASMNDCGFSPAVDAPGKASEQEALAEAEHDGMDLFTALRTLFPHDLPSMSAAKRAARRNRAYVRRAGCDKWPTTPATGKHRKDETEKMAVRAGDSVRLLSLAGAIALSSAKKKTAFLAEVEKSLHAALHSVTGENTEQQQRKARDSRARALTGVDLRVVFEDEDLAVVFKPGKTQ